ncbi:uncharacterized protein A4U43_C03F10010 [Asparagus officinalis]|uniref:Homeobox domain-containing protein n=1 Tax=Asparagus officinalis TaxID=4686 RepID=A0A5P1F9J9_ASPOF|nr:uncharacterized protein A4U43_C03F10010 [Asparagus officinalis]
MFKFLHVQDDQFCDDIDKLIYEEERLMKLDSGDESQSNNLDSDVVVVEPIESKKKKPYQRYSPAQTKRLQEIFAIKRHPCEEERRALGEELGLDPLRVKFWFQNRRSQTKKKNEKDENTHLKEENRMLKVQNDVYKICISTATCSNCGLGPNPHDTSAARAEVLRAENEFVKEEILKLSGVIDRCLKKKSPFAVEPPGDSSVIKPAGDPGVTGLEAEPDINPDEALGFVSK